MGSRTKLAAGLASIAALGIVPATSAAEERHLPRHDRSHDARQRPRASAGDVRPTAGPCAEACRRSRGGSVQTAARSSVCRSGRFEANAKRNPSTAWLHRSRCAL